jgi:hypothetical protein
MTIRTLQTLEKVSSEPSQKTLVLIPSDMTHSSLAQAIAINESNK